MEDMKFVVLYGSYRRDRLGIRPAKFVADRLGKRARVQFIDAMEVGLPMLDLRYFEYEKGTAPDNLENAAKALREMDGLVIVTGEYNRTLPPGLSNFIDHFNAEYINKPVALISYSTGGFGGVRAAEHLRSSVGNLGMISFPNYHPFPLIEKEFDGEGNPTNPKTEERFNRFLDKWIPFAKVIKEANDNGKFG